MQGITESRAEHTWRGYDVWIAAASVATVLYLPYWIPQSPTASDSYTFGYNNRAGVLLVLLLAAGIAVWKKGYGFGLSSSVQSKTVSRRVLGAALAIETIACMGVALLIGGLGGFAESNYELDRLDLLARGGHPYTGFEWPFGPALLYGPLWLSRALHLGAVDAYDLFWLSCSLAGVVLLYAIIGELEYATEHKTAIFVMLFLAFLPSALELGTHYTLLRYAAPLYCILRVYRNGTSRRVWWAAVQAVLFTAILFLLSPDMAIAHGFACCVLLFPRHSRINQAAIKPGPYAVMLVCLCLILGAALRLHLLDTLRASGGGADSLPIPLSVPTLCFFAAVFACACAVVQRIQGLKPNDNLAALIVISIPLLAAALGRCDPEHMLSNGLGFFIVALILASSSATMWRWARNAFVIGMLLIPSFVVVRYIVPLAATAAEDNMAVESETGKTGFRAAFARIAVNMWPHQEVEDLRRVAPPDHIDFQILYPGVDPMLLRGVLDAPFGYRPGHWTTYHSNAVEYGYYEGSENANTPHAIERKIQELAADPERAIFLPDDSGSLCDTHAQLDRAVIAVYFFFPYTAHVTHPVSPRKPLCDYIFSHYVRAQPATSQNFHYELWVPAKEHPGP